ncbi:MAG: hypothetical protein II935_02845 [Bacteroidales bacterium]|nr:hypothetical protein [Bacteroidales bacterium]MBR3798628.1 hypothetical protein [Bacteroidales bacterium]
MTDNKQKTNYGALSILIIVFFFWGFMAAGNSIFIPFCKHYFNLDQFQSQLIDFAFYLAYYVGALILFAYSVAKRSDFIAKSGYKKSIVYGLLLSAVGAAAMIVAVGADNFTGMLIGLFVVGLGFSLQQTAGNPFAITLGPPATGASRINLCGGLNSFGTAIGPIIVALLLFGTTAAVSDEEIASLEISKAQILYAGVGVLFLIAAAIFFFSKKLPNDTSDEKTEKSSKALVALTIMTVLLVAMFIPVFMSYRESFADMDNVEIFRVIFLLAALLIVFVTLLSVNGMAKKKSEGWGAMKYPQLVFGMLAIFVYVGVEVSTVSNFGELLQKPDFGGFAANEVAPFISMYWGSLMIGRWTGAVAAFEFKSLTKKILTIVVPLVAFGVVLGVNAISQYSIVVLLPYIALIAIQIAAFFFTKNKPARTLFIFAVLAVCMMLVGICTEGMVSVYAIMAGGLFCSIMWSSIFNLALAGLGKYTTQGSAFLVMMILGGAVIPPIQGKLADYMQTLSSNEGFGIHYSYVIPVLCFAFLAFFAIYVKRILKKQGIDYDSEV